MIIRPSVIAWLLLGLLGACDSAPPSETGRNGQPAAEVPSGEIPLTGDAFDVQNRLPPAELGVAFEELTRPGIDVEVLEVDALPALLVLIVEAAAFEPVLAVPEARGAGITAREAVTQQGLDVVVGSSFVSELNGLSPVGLLQVDGTVLHALEPHGYTRVLGLREEGLAVIDKGEFHRGMFDSALQLGPGIVEQGQLDIRERDLQRQPYFRAFVGTCGSRMLVGASLRPMHLYSLGQRLLVFAEERGLACDELVNLAGDREMVLGLAAADGSRMVYLGNPATAKAALLGLRRRR